jgi:hypothetical protein
VKTTHVPYAATLSSKPGGVEPFEDVDVGIGDGSLESMRSSGKPQRISW